jgi:transmembrane sensor
MNNDSLAKLRPRMEPHWDEQRSARVRKALERRVRRERRLRIGVGVGSLGLLLLTLFVVHVRGLRGLAPWAGQAPTATNAPPSNAARVTLLSPDSVVTPQPEGHGREFTLQTGGARFVVPHDAAHPFRVHVAALSILDLGTVFTVRLSATGTTEVRVEEGRVRVISQAQSIELGAGEQHSFEGVSAPSDARRTVDAGVDDDSNADPPAKPPSAVAAWRPLAENGQYREAYESLRKAGRAVVHDDVGELLLAADAARLSGHPADAVPYLQQAVHSHGGDPRASLAYFTLGRVLLDELGRPSEAATAFEHARRGQLAEDALAREVEAYSRAGDVTRARSLALDYERLYPSGRRARAVAKFGGIE